MIRRSDAIFSVNTDQETFAFGPASERSAGLMLSLVRSPCLDAKSDPGDWAEAGRFTNGGEAAFIHASGSVRLDGPPSAAAPDFPAVLDLATLDGDNGFRIDGVDAYDSSGWSVASAGDFNGDGVDDIIIGARLADPGGRENSGESYVVFGRDGGFAADVDLAALDGTNGLRIDGAGAGDQSGYSVASAGDVNGDGFDDVIIGAGFADIGSDLDAGASYVVFGGAIPLGGSLDLSALDGTDGFRLDGVNPYDFSGLAVASAGDVNGDGVDDLVIGAIGSDEGAFFSGESYVVFGHEGAFAATMDLSTLDGTNGFRMTGDARNDFSGQSVSSAGDVNGDGFDDIIIGAYGVGHENGASYVVFGGSGAFAASLDLAELDGANGFRIDGIDRYDRSGFSVSSAGDVNGDGFDDIMIGAPYADPGGVNLAGESYVVFGMAGGFSATLDLAQLDGSNGFRLEGTGGFDGSGSSVAAAGDVNGDGFDDIIVGAYRAYSGDALFRGESYVVFGKSGGFGAAIDLGALDGTDGFRIDGIDALDRSGTSVAAAGDMNNDGFDDLVIGAPTAGSDATEAGESYVIFGQAPGEAVTRIGSEADQTIRGGEFGDLLRGKEGDDVLVGAGGDDWLRGGHDADDLQGGDGADRMQGGSGHDSLMGGAGADVFVLASTSADDSDTLIDFTSGEDRIALGDKAFGLSEGVLDPNSFVIGSAAGDADDRLIYDNATGKLFFDADGAGGTAQVLIATLNDAPTLTASDIIVV